jgi:hypothetical protein
MSTQKVPLGHIDTAAAAALVTLTDATTIAVDWSSFNVAEVTLGGNRTLGAPTNTVPGTTRYIFVKGSGLLEFTLTFHANYKGNIPTLADITSNQWYLLTLVCYSSTHIVIAAVRAR